LERTLTLSAIVLGAVYGIAQLVGVASNVWALLIAVIAAVVALALKLISGSAEQGFTRRQITVAVVAVPLLLAMLWVAQRNKGGHGDGLRHVGAGPAMIHLRGGEVDVSHDSISSFQQVPKAPVVADLLVDQFEVTNLRYAACVAAKVCEAPSDPSTLSDPLKDAWPVGGVTATQASTFCAWLGRRLPTELEWVRIAFGTSDHVRTWPWGEEPPSPTRANVNFGGSSTTASTPTTGPLDSLPPDVVGNADPRSPVAVTELDAGRSPDGVAHLLGNVSEWTSTSPDLCATGYDCSRPWRPDTHVSVLNLRGESFESLVTPSDVGPQLARQATPATPNLREADVGFRCVADSSSRSEDS
jgi:formylglycine-generating enzyme required for sulfatase activity